MIIPQQLKMAHLPTPIESLPRLSVALGGPKIIIKRDDQTGLALGGNKTRKLEFLMADAQVNGARTVITGGACQSNHCRQTAAAAARFGMKCILVLSGDPPASVSGNLLLDHILGAEIVWCGTKTRDQVLQETFETAENNHSAPYLIPYGGSNAIGAASYAFAIKEMMEQNCHPDWIIIASSSGGTQAGLVAGARLFGFDGRILGISIDESADDLKMRVAQLAGQTTAWLNTSEEFNAENILVNDDYLGGGYGVMGGAERDAIRLFANTEGIFLDPVYTGRAAAGMTDLIKKDYFGSDETILFWHTGGTPALFADIYAASL